MIHLINGQLIISDSIGHAYQFDNGWSSIMLHDNRQSTCVLRIPTNTLVDYDERHRWIMNKHNEFKRNGGKDTEFIVTGFVTGDELLPHLAKIAALPPIDDAARAAKVADDMLAKIRKR